MDNKKLLPVKSDLIFSLFFADERNREFLAGFLKSILNLPEDDYREIEIVDPHLLREFDGDKLGIIDVKLHTRSGKTIHIEIQLHVVPELRNRILFYEAKLIAEQIGSGDDYDAIKKVISIVIMDENLITANTRYHHRFSLYDAEAGVELTDLLEVHTLELDKLPEQTDGTQLYDWAKFIDAESEEELRMVEARNPQVGEVVVEYRELSADERIRDTYFRREMMRRGISMLSKHARREGREEGRQEGIISIARNLLSEGDPIDKIVRLIGLTREEVEALRE